MRGGTAAPSPEGLCHSLSSFFLHPDKGGRVDTARPEADKEWGAVPTQPNSEGMAVGVPRDRRTRSLFESLGGGVATVHMGEGWRLGVPEEPEINGANKMALRLAGG